MGGLFFTENCHAFLTIYGNVFITRVRSEATHQLRNDKCTKKTQHNLNN